MLWSRKGSCRTIGLAWALVEILQETANTEILDRVYSSNEIESGALDLRAAVDEVVARFFAASASGKAGLGAGSTGLITHLNWPIGTFQSIWG